MVGFFKENMDFQTFYDRLLMKGQHEVKATFMGGNMVLLSCPNAGEMDEAWKCNKQWWENCFLKVIPWRPRLVSECRETWIQVFGIPLHAWEEGTFKMVAGRFGVFLDFDEATASKQRLDVARIKLRTVWRGLIDTVLQLKVMGELFDVWVVEERCGCGEDRSFEVEVGHRNGVQSNSNSGDGGWRGDDGDMFSEDITDSDSSESGEVALGIQEEGNIQLSATPVDNEGIRNVEVQSQTLLQEAVGERGADQQVESRHVEREGENMIQIPRAAGVGEVPKSSGVEVGPMAVGSNILLEGCEVLKKRVQSVGDVSVGPSLAEVEGCFGPIGSGCISPLVNVDHGGPTNLGGIMAHVEGIPDPTLPTVVEELCETVQSNVAELECTGEVDGNGRNDAMWCSLCLLRASI
jgi:hypothetical protein